MPVYKFKDGRKGWYFQFYFQGKKIKKERWNGNHMDSKIEAQKAEYECKLQLEKEKNEGIGLYQLFAEFCATAKGNLKPSTQVRTYDKFRRLYLSLIEDKNIYQLTSNDFLDWKNKIVKLQTTADYKNRLLNIMKACLNYGTIMYNIPGKLQYALFEKINEYNVIEIEEKKSEYIPLEDFKRLCSPLLDYPEYDISKSNFYYYVIFNLIYFTGVRIGELAALTINDFKSDYLVINKNYIRLNKKDLIQSPKTTNSIRKVFLDQDTKKLLEEYIEIFKPKNVLFKIKSNYVNQQKVRTILRELAKISGLDKIYKVRPHTLRHSHASNLRKLGYDEYVISSRLGNTPKVSAAIYIHSEEKEQKELALKLRSNT